MAPSKPAGRGHGQHRALAAERKASALMLSTILSALLGAVFWVVAARLYTPAQMGRASALMSAVTLLAGVAQLNMVSVFLRFLPASGGGARTFILRGYAASMLAAGLVLTGFLLLGLGDRYLPANLPARAFFSVAVFASAIYFIQDGVLTALRGTVWVPVENGLMSLGKLLLLPLFAVYAGDTGAFLAGSLPVLAAVGTVNCYVFGRLVPRHLAAGKPAQLPPAREIRRFVAAEYCASILGSLASFVPPLMVARLLGAEASGYFAIPWLAGASFGVLLWNVAGPFVVDVVRDEGQTWSVLRRSVRLGALVTVLAVIGVEIGAPLLSVVLGSGYARQGEPALRLIGAAFPFMALNVLFCAFAVLRKRMWLLAAIQAVETVGFLGTAAVLTERWGITGTALAFLLAQAVFGLLVVVPITREWRAVAAVAAVSTSAVAKATGGRGAGVPAGRQVRAVAQDLVVNRLVASAWTPRGVRVVLYRLAGAHLQSGSVGPRCRIDGPLGNVRIGPRLRMASACRLDASAPITIGADCSLRTEVVILTKVPPERRPGRVSGGGAIAHPVTIGNRVRIGAGARILPGVTIGDGAVISPGATVTTDLPRSQAGRPGRERHDPPAAGWRFGGGRESEDLRAT